jgi:HTH-type transcriptional regulator/antitoxin HigA
MPNTTSSVNNTQKIKIKVNIMGYEQLKLKADELFSEAPFIIEIKTNKEYQNALALMDELIEDYDKQRPLIEILSASIERWENTADEFSEFNQRIDSLDNGVSTLKLLMEQNGLGIANVPEIGSNTLASKVLNGKRNLTKNHIEA